jgi:hypothetical protein
LRLGGTGNWIGIQGYQEGRRQLARNRKRWTVEENTYCKVFVH